MDVMTHVDAKEVERLRRDNERLRELFEAALRWMWVAMIYRAGEKEREIQDRMLQDAIAEACGIHPLARGYFEVPDDVAEELVRRAEADGG